METALLDDLRLDDLRPGGRGKGVAGAIGGLDQGVDGECIPGFVSSFCKGHDFSGFDSNRERPEAERGGQERLHDAVGLESAELAE